MRNPCLSVGFDFMPPHGRTGGFFSHPRHWCHLPFPLPLPCIGIPLQSHSVVVAKMFAFLFPSSHFAPFVFVFSYFFLLPSAHFPVLPPSARFCPINLSRFAPPQQHTVCSPKNRGLLLNARKLVMSPASPFGHKVFFLVFAQKRIPVYIMFLIFAKLILFKHKN